MNHTVLVVDDEPLVRATLATLEDWTAQGYDFRFEAPNGAVALQLLEDHPEIDIVLLDLTMPVLDGIGLLERLAETERGPTSGALAVVVLSAHDAFALVRRAFTLGARDYILKSDIDGPALAAALRASSATLETTRSNAVVDRLQREVVVDQWLKDGLGGARAWDELPETLRGALVFPLVLWAVSPESGVTPLLVRTARQVVDRHGGGRVVAVGNELAVLASPPDAALVTKELQANIERYLSQRAFVRSSDPLPSAAELPAAWARLLQERPRTSRVVYQTMKYLAETFASPTLPLEELAQRVGVSRNHLSYEFARETGETITEHVARLRVEAACQLLATSTLKVYEIAERVGYNNVENFSRMFRKVTGTSPNRWVSRTEGENIRDSGQ